MDSPIVTAFSTDSWETDVTNPFVLQTTSNHYDMWYTSINSEHWVSGIDRFRLRHAYSVNGLTWHSDENWQLTGTIGKWDEGGLDRGKTIILKNGIYYLFYAATNDNNLGTNPFWRIGLATSVDGIHWIKQNNGNPVITPTETWELNNVSYPTVLYEDGLFKMWYGAGTADEPMQIDYAYSVDGINWTKPANENPAMIVSASGFDSKFINPNSIIHDGNLYKLWYSGYDGNQWNIGYATMLASTVKQVPLLKQTDPAWGAQTYDGAENWDPQHKTIGDWGCAMTSAAMVLKSHGINKLPDGTELDPGTLNTWLKNQSDGYIDGISSGYMNPLAITRLAKQAISVNNITSFDALEYQHISGADKTKLTDDLNNGQPDILEVPGHFIVATSADGNTFDINDPYYERNDLNEGYNNTFLSLNRYIPSHTDLSYILMTVNPNISVTIKDANGQTVGDQFIQQPYTDPLNNNHTGGTPIKMIFVQKPATGNYQITLSGTNDQNYQLHTYFYDKNGNVNTNASQGTVGTNKSDSLTVTFNNQDSTKSVGTRVVTFQNFIDDINENIQLHQINKNIGNALIPLISSAQESANKNQKLAAKLKLDAIELAMKALRNKGISESAFQILLYDDHYLKTHL